MNVWTRTSRLNEVFRYRRTDTPSTYYASDSDVVIYFWPEDQLPENLPSNPRLYLFDGTTWTLKSEDPGFKVLLAEDTRTDLLVRSPADLSEHQGGSLQRHGDGHSKLSFECEMRICDGYDAHDLDHEIHTRERLFGHADPDSRAWLDPRDAERDRLARRYETLKAAVNGLDLMAPAQRVLLNDFVATYRQDHWWTDGPLALPAGWPTYEVPAADLAKWSDATTVHDVDRQAEHELETIFDGSLIPALLTAMLRTEPASQRVITVNRRHGVLRAQTPPPEDITDPNLWGHDVRVTITATAADDPDETRPVVEEGPDSYKVPEGSVIQVVPVDSWAVVSRLADSTAEAELFSVVAEDGWTKRNITVLNSLLFVTIDQGESVTVAPGWIIALDATGFGPVGELLSYQWGEVEGARLGGTFTPVAGDRDSVRYSVPIDAEPGTFALIEMTVRTSAGVTATARIRINIEA